MHKQKTTILKVK